MQRFISMPSNRILLRTILTCLTSLSIATADDKVPLPNSETLVFVTHPLESIRVGLTNTVEWAKKKNFPIIVLDGGIAKNYIPPGEYFFIQSHQGEFTNSGKISKFIFAGGFLEMCLNGTMLQTLDILSPNQNRYEMFLVSDAIYVESTTLSEWIKSHSPTELFDFMWKKVFNTGWNGHYWTDRVVPKYTDAKSEFKLVLHYKSNEYTFGKGIHGAKEIHVHIVDSLRLP